MGSNETFTGPNTGWDGAHVSFADLDNLDIDMVGTPELAWPKDPPREGGPGWNETEKYLEWVNEYVDQLSLDQREQLQRDIQQRRAEDYILERVIIDRRSEEEPQ